MVPFHMCIRNNLLGATGLLNSQWVAYEILCCSYRKSWCFPFLFWIKLHRGFPTSVSAADTPPTYTTVKRHQCLHWPAVNIIRKCCLTCFSICWFQLLWILDQIPFTQWVVSRWLAVSNVEMFECSHCNNYYRHYFTYLILKIQSIYTYFLHLINLHLVKLQNTLYYS